MTWEEKFNKLTEMISEIGEKCRADKKQAWTVSEYDVAAEGETVADFLLWEAKKLSNIPNEEPSSLPAETPLPEELTFYEALQRSEDPRVVVYRILPHGPERHHERVMTPQMVVIVGDLQEMWYCRKEKKYDDLGRKVS